MKAFRRIPLIVQAVQVTDATFDAPHPNPDHIADPGIVYDTVNRYVWLRPPNPKTPETPVAVGDWIIREVDGSFSKCRSDVFEMTYEAV